MTVSLNHPHASLAPFGCADEARPAVDERFDERRNHVAMAAYDRAVGQVPYAVEHLGNRANTGLVGELGETVVGAHFDIDRDGKRLDRFDTPHIRG
ncbi:MAG: hypothetical protein RL072_188 [Actinomycetota bacterium]